MLAVTLMLAGTGGRLARLMAGGSGAAEAAAQIGKTVTVARPRGDFYDRNGRRLTGVQTRTVAVLPPTVAAVAALTEQVPGPRAAAALAVLKGGDPALVEVSSDFACADALTFTLPVRTVGSQPAVHLLGYLDGSGHGVTGLEAAFDAWLSDQPPLTVTYTVDATGRPLAGLSPEVSGSPTAAHGIMLTLDNTIQRLAEEAAAPLETGALLVMESATGNLLAAVSRPTFSPLNVAAALTAEHAPLVNRTLSAYNVGSVFKLCVAAAALKAGFSPGRTATCTGVTDVGGTLFHCHKKAGHGTLTMAGALENSCNCCFIDLGQALGGRAILDLCVRLGFNRAYTLAEGLSAPAGTLPSESVLAAQPAALANLSFGQGDLMLTPLHVAVMVAAIANGGWQVTPQLVAGKRTGANVERMENAAPRRVLSEEDTATLRAMMEGVVTQGTGRAAQPESGIAGGKTATAETGWVVEGRTIQQAWFAGYWPASGEYTIVVLREDGSGGGADCAPVFKSLVDAMAREGF